MVATKPLAGKIALVTGATRGIGRGIAVQLGEAGATVYVTGRTLTSKDGSIGSLEDTANEIRNRGGHCIPMVVDHEDDSQISYLFQKIEKEQNGRLDILVNNAYKAVHTIFENSGQKFWECKPEIWDEVNNVGLRNHYICTVYAARLMVPRKQGLIINISSWGGHQYIFNCAYGIGKCAVDRMAADCGIELKRSNVAMISLYPGAVKTEIINSFTKKYEESEDTKEQKTGNKFKQIFEDGESTEFSGKIVVALAQDPNIMKYTGKVVISADYAQSHGLRDIDNRVIYSYRQVKFMAGKMLPDKFKFIANFIPSFVKVPQFVLSLFSSKF